jgi:DNA-directed RNA polymerase specialized sigma24 family protein
MQINKETIEQLFRQHYLRMYQLARVLLKDDAASKDVVSEVFTDVLDGKTQLCLDNETITSDSPLPSANAGSYLLVCVRHKCLNLLSRQKMKDREIATELGISEVAVYKHLAQGIRKLKQKFNP